MPRRTVTVDGLTFEGRWLPTRGLLHVAGPLEYRRPVRAAYTDSGDWMDGPTGRPDSDRSRRFWMAARQLAAIYNDELLLADDDGDLDDGPAAPDPGAIREATTVVCRALAESIDAPNHGLRADHIVAALAAAGLLATGGA